MSRLAYVCLSDLHLGADDSILNRIGPSGEATASPVLEELACFLGTLVPSGTSDHERPVLVLAGDAIDLALAPDDRALGLFRRFIGLLGQAGAPFRQIMYVPGNHDHRVWTTARDTMFANSLAELSAEDPVASFPHASTAFAGIPAFVLSNLLKTVEKAPPVAVAYPNYAVLHEDAAGSQRAVVFTHGHFVDAPYWLMSYLISWAYPESTSPGAWPQTVEEWEEQNGAWIDFLWSSMGACGRLEQTTELVWDAVRDRKKRDLLVTNLLNGLSRRVRGGKAGWVVDHAVTKVVDAIVDEVKTERGGREEALSPSATKRLGEFVTGPLMRQLGEKPSDLTVMFGHTHKPTLICEDLCSSPAVFPMRAHNTGGWVVDGPEPSALHGADLALINDELEVASISLFRQDESFTPQIGDTQCSEKKPSEFVDDLRATVDHNSLESLATLALVEVRDHLGTIASG